MWQNAHDAYLESRVLSADPLELVRMLYQACKGSVREARSHLASGNIAGRSQCISQAHEILTELAGALDHSRGGDLSRRLAELYDYMQRRLLEANIRQTDEPLSEVFSLLSTLSEAWMAIREQSEPAAPAPSPWSQPMATEPSTGYSAGGWSL